MADVHRPIHPANSIEKDSPITNGCSKTNSDWKTLTEEKEKSTTTTNSSSPITKPKLTSANLLERAAPSHSTLPKETVKRKSATLTPNSNSNGTSGTAPFTRNNFRRSFTLPRSLLNRKNNGQSQNGGPASENRGSILQSFFLTFVRTHSMRRPKNKNGQNNATTANGQSDQISNGTNGTWFPPGFVPAAVGLKNQGNTCFMNAIVQCISHTDVLAKYLVTDAYKNDLRKKYWIKSGKGEVTEELASILKSTWFRLNATALEESASKFKSAVERGSCQWKGSEQQDAQEFLLWLLNRLHEDLNQAATNKYKPIKNNFGRPDEQVAAEAWANHLRCNNSIIEDIFGAQFRSSLTCPGCGRQSATFDPFICVSLPIPQARQELPVYVNIVYLSQQPRQVKIGLSVSASADVKELKQLLSADTGIDENDILLSEIDGEGFHRTFIETQSVSVLSSNNALYCIQSPVVKDVNENDGAFLMITWTNILITNNESNTRVRFGSPYVTQISRETGIADLHKILLKEMATIIQPGILISEQKDPVFSIRILDGSSEGSLVENVEHPLYMEAVDHALSLCDEDVPPHIKIHLEWTPEFKDKIIAEESESVEEHSSVAQTRLKYSEEVVSTVTLGECFDLYTRAEQLSAEDTWHCPHCNRKEQGTLKMIGLWSAPQVLVVHLKRFRQVSRGTTKGRQAVTKLSSVVDFPTDGLDLCPHISKRSARGQDAAMSTQSNGSFNSSQASSPMNGCFGLGSWKNRASFKKHISTVSNSRMNNMNELHNGFSTDDGSPGALYDLFAVCNHHGKDLQGGHYTAYCKNPVNNTWWSFDDTRVVQLASEADVKTSSAYILFYQRRQSGLNGTAPLPNPLPNHWCRPLLKKHHKVPLNPRLPPPVNPATTDTKPTMNGSGETYAAEAQRVLSQVEATETNGYHHLNGASDGEKDYNGYTRSSTTAAPLAQIEETTTAYEIHPDIQIESTV